MGPHDWLATKTYRFWRRIFDAPNNTEMQRRRIYFDSSAFTAIYAIGDVHGCHQELVEAHHRILSDALNLGGNTVIVLLGDYVDRGPNSRAVIEFLSVPVSPPMYRIALCGNHDNEFLKFYRDPLRNLAWLTHGGRETLLSYGIDADYLLMSRGGRKAFVQVVKQTIPERHVDFLRSLPIALQIGKLIFVHAGIRPGMELDKQKDSDLLWIREPFLSKGPESKLLVVHGHTANPEPSFGRRRIGIDTGAYATGRLTTLKIFDGKAEFL